MRKASILVTLGTLLAMTAGSAHALGFGRIGGSTTLGQQLNFSAVVRLESDEIFGSECASAEVFSGENKLPAGFVRVAVEPAASANERIVRVTTTTLLDEPVVTVNLGVGCNAKLNRRFVVLLDPPLINLPQAVAAVPLPVVAEAPRTDTESGARAPSSSSSTSTAAAPTAASAPVPARRVIRPRPRPQPKPLVITPRAPNVAASPEASRSKPKQAAEGPLAQPAPTGPRLKLESPVPTAGARASDAATSLASAAASAASAASQAASDATKTDDQGQLIAKERERLQALEDSLARLRAETQSTQKTLATLQTRLKGAEADRFSNPLVYALAGLCAVLLLAVAAMWRRNSLREASWWSQPIPDVGDDLGGASPAPAGQPPAVPTLLAEVEGDARVVPAFERSGASALDDDPISQSPADDRSATPRRRELSVEELIDLEQQAEFFVVLGQDEAAIDLLMGHLRSTGGGSPLPYLKLLEIYRRRGEREQYDRTRERFNRRFNAYAPEWESDPALGRSLEDYPAMIQSLQGLWSKPTEVIELLDESLFRRDLSVDTFDVPAYRELVLLYSVVRDIAEHDGTAEVVDLLLPIDDGGSSVNAFDAHATEPVPFVSVTELSAADRRASTLDLDISSVRAFERPLDLEVNDSSSTNLLGLFDGETPPAKPGNGNR